MIITGYRGNGKKDRALIINQWREHFRTSKGNSAFITMIMSVPQFAGRSIRQTPSIHIPANVQRADVPIDPALAVISRFGELSK
ncbi:hypothetical protein [Paenibacillus periandrae]|uniref:hypothetical protein n=1 Tax=Paenibacillus periandrae TaxID=1761741 RepID=UPI001F09AC5B|nr:hypothetical protein [Paenibacillus periandrae]